MKNMWKILKNVFKNAFPVIDVNINFTVGILTITKVSVGWSVDLWSEYGHGLCGRITVTYHKFNDILDLIGHAERDSFVETDEYE